MTRPSLRTPATLVAGAERAEGVLLIAVGAGAGAGEDSWFDWVAQPATRPVIINAARLVFMLLLPVSYATINYAPNYICANMNKLARRKGADRRRMLEVLEQFRVIVKSIRRHYQDVERRAGVSGAQLWALAQIAEQPGGQVGELARALAVHQSTASNLVRGLEKRRLVTRARGGRDLRHVQLYPSKQGLALLKAAPRPLIGVLQQALSEMPAARLVALQAQLAHVVALMRRKQVAAARALPLSEM